MRKSILLSELLWLIITAILIILISVPIYSSGVVFDFWPLLIGSIFVFVVGFRIIFLLKSTWFGTNIYVQATLIFICLPLFFILYNGIHSFLSYLDFGDLNVRLEGLALDERRFLLDYIRQATIFTSVASLLVVVLVPFKLLVSIWKLFRRRAPKQGL